MHFINVVMIIAAWAAHVLLNQKWPIAIVEVVLAFNGVLLSGISCHLFRALYRILRHAIKGSPQHRRLRAYLRFLFCAALLGLGMAVSQIASAVNNVGSDAECCSLEQSTIEKKLVDQIVIMVTLFLFPSLSDKTTITL
jgi:hypothetical protein